MTSSERELKNVETNHNTPEKKKGFTRTQKLVGTGIILIALTCAGGFAVYHNNQNTSPNSSSQTTTPESTTPVNISDKLGEKYSYKMEKYKEMSVDEFEALPRDERLQYSQYLIDRTVDKRLYNYSDAYGDSKPGHPYAVKPTQASLNNSGQEILDNYLYTLQIATLQATISVDLNKLVHNSDDGQKVLSSAYYDVGINKSVSRQYLAAKHSEQTIEQPGYLANKFTLIETSDLLNDKNDSSGKAVQYKIISYSEKNTKGEVVISNARFIYDEYVGYDDEEAAVWRFNVQTSTKEELDATAI